MYWINPKLYKRSYDRRLSSPPSSATTTVGTSSRKTKRRLDFPSPESTISSLTTVSSPPTTTMATVSDVSLGVDGKLNCRLDITRDHHAGLPLPNTRCQLHWWCAPADDKMRWRQNLLYCHTYNITMSLQCYRLFHTEENIVQKKVEIEKKLRKTYTEDRDSRNTNDKNTKKSQKKNENRTRTSPPI